MLIDSQVSRSNVKFKGQAYSYMLGKGDCFKYNFSILLMFVLARP